MAMNPNQRKALDNKNREIINRVQNPELLAGLLKTNVFTTSDFEEIKAAATNKGATMGAAHLLSLLQKRGAKAFYHFIDALQSEIMKLGDLADELLEEERRLQGKPASKAKKQLSLPVSIEEEEYEQSDELDGPPPPYSAPAGHAEVTYNFCPQEYQQSNMACSVPDSSQTHQEQTVTNFGPDTPVKKIPYRVRSKLEKLLNPLDASRHDWRGVASAMNLNLEEVRALDSCNDDHAGRMGGLFEKMVQTKKTIKDLLGWLNHAEVQRYDAIEELEKQGIISGPDWSSELLEDEESEEQKSAVMSPVEESVSTPKALLSPLQESEVPSKMKGHTETSKLEARVPSQVEEQDDISKCASGITKDARVPSQVEESDSKDFTKFPSQEEQVESTDSFASDDNNDDVFVGTGELKKHALLISCVNHKEHNMELQNLEEVLENSGWEVTIVKKCKMSKLHLTVKDFLREADRSACFVYLVGTTININGDNYLVPNDLKEVSSRADLMHGALNINQLVKQLKDKFMQIVIVDGVQEDGVLDLSYPGVLPGLAPICPPPNAVISFSHSPGANRPDQERLLYIRSAVKHLSVPNTLTLVEFFDEIRRDVSQEASSSPVEFSLMPSLLPFCLNSTENQGLQVPSEKTTRHAIIFANARYKGEDFGHVVYKEAERLNMALLKFGWKSSVFCDNEAKSVMQNFRTVVDQLAGKELKVVMVYFIGYTQMINDSNYFFGVDFHVRQTLLDIRSSVPLQWALDLMCEKICGPKLLIVDDLNKCLYNGLAKMTAPQEVLISLPNSSGDGRDTDADASFTSNFTKLLEASRGWSLKEIVQKASFARHRVNSSTFFA